MSHSAAQTEADPKDSMEAAYRRGYQQGANDTLMAVERMVRARLDFSDLRNWIGLTLYDWRYHDRIEDRSVEPPTPPCA